MRSCDNPSPSVGGIWCEGNDTDIQSCNNETCPGKADGRNCASIMSILGTTLTFHLNLVVFVLYD